MKAIFPEVFPFYVRVINEMKLKCCTFILKNVINYTDESRAASSVNRYTRNKYIFLTEPNTFFSISITRLCFNANTFLRRVSSNTLRLWLIILSRASISSLIIDKRAAARELIVGYITRINTGIRITFRQKERWFISNFPLDFKCS